MWTSQTHCLFCVPKIVDIDQYLLKSFENITGVRSFWTTVYVWYALVDLKVKIKIYAPITGSKYWANKNRPFVTSCSLKDANAQYWLYVILNVNYFHTEWHTFYFKMSCDYLLDLLFCQSTTVILDTQLLNARMFLERIRYADHYSKWTRWLLNFARTFANTNIVLLTAYYLRNMRGISLRSDRPWRPLPAFRSNESAIVHKTNRPFLLTAF